MIVHFHFISLIMRGGGLFHPHIGYITVVLIATVRKVPIVIFIG